MENNKHFKLAYTEDGQGLPILFIHGYPLSKNLWEEQVRGLSAHFRCIAPDLRGYGGSWDLTIAYEGYPYPMEMLAEDCAHLLDDLGIEEPLVISGLSMGGYVSFAFYRLFPQRVRALILTATRPGADSPQAQAARDDAIITATLYGSEAIIEPMLPKLLSPRTYTNNPELVERVRRIMGEATVKGIIGSLEGMKERPDSTPMLPKISCPTLIISGADDQIIPTTESLAMKNSIPNAELAVIDNAGHLPNMEQPEIYNQAVLRFLNALSS